MTRDNCILPLHVTDLLRSVPRRGEGLNLWLFRAAFALAHYRSPQEIVAFLEVATVGDPVRPGEIHRAVTRAVKARSAWRWQPGIQSFRPWPEFEPEKRQAVISAGAGLVDLWELSPYRLEGGDDDDPEKIMDLLFEGNPWLCVGKSGKDCQTLRREDWRGKLAKNAVMVPSPMTGKFGLTQDGRKSQRTLQNTGSRRYLVIESDRGSLDEQAAILIYLGERAPLKLVVFSGNKSLHGWFFCENQPEETLRNFMALAIRLGADPATWVRSQPVRIPGGRRDNGAVQSIYFLNLPSKK